jgi:hypothetical protein
MRGDVGTVGLADAGVLMLVAGDAAKAEVVQNLLLNMLFEQLRGRLIVVESKCYAKMGIQEL